MSASAKRAQKKYTEKQHRRRKLLIKLCGGKCKRCKEKRYVLLQFHHLLDLQHLKRFPLNWRHMRRKLKDILREVNICIVLCSNCHILVHEGIVREPKRGKEVYISQEDWDNV